MREGQEPQLPLYLTFDDVLILPGLSEVLPTQAQTETELAENLKLHMPLISSAMDTVTEYKTSITMAQHGGLGIIHKNLSIEEQAREVLRVKKFILEFAFHSISSRIFSIDSRYWSMKKKTLRTGCPSNAFCPIP